jgi:hypothetical protein
MRKKAFHTKIDYFINQVLEDPLFFAFSIFHFYIHLISENETQLQPWRSTKYQRRTTIISQEVQEVKEMMVSFQHILFRIFIHLCFNNSPAGHTVQGKGEFCVDWISSRMDGCGLLGGCGSVTSALYFLQFHQYEIK